MKKFAFIGAGRMASAIVKSLVRGDPTIADKITCMGGDDDTAKMLSEATGCRATDDPTELMAGAEVAVLAVKPQQLKALDPCLIEGSRGVLMISILAGVTIARLREAFPEARSIVRSMPNTPGQIGAGATAYAAERDLSESEDAMVQQVLGALGKVYPVSEDQLDAVTALSGSGPAYVFEFIAGLREAGMGVGLERTMAESLALETVLGAAKLLETTGEDPETLRNAVTSPGGTTQAGLLVMDSLGFRSLLDKTVQAARDRSIDLAQES